MLHEPNLEGNEERYLLECVRSALVSSVGPFVARFEKELAAFTGARHAVAVVNGTAALQMALVMAGVQPGDEVLVPALTFVGTANAIHHAGAVPHFVDSAESTLGLDAEAMAKHLRVVAHAEGKALRNRATGRRIAAVVPVHVYGHPVDIARLSAVCEEFGIALVEDAAESLGSYGSDGRHTGTSGVVAALSFNGNKIVTTGGGGALLTDDQELAARAKHLTTTAKKPHAWRFDHDAIGWNYRMPNINAALGCAQLERLPMFLTAKRRLAQRYAEALSGLPEARFVSEPAGCRSNYWLNVVRLAGGNIERRDAAITALNDAGIGARPAWTLLSRLPMHEHSPRAPLPVAELLEAEIINLPSGFSVARTI